MTKEKRSIQPLIYAFVVFIAIGITVANEVLARVGMEGNYIFVFSLALLIVLLLVGKDRLMFLLVGTGIVLINLPDSVLSNNGIDRDILLASVCAVILVPAIYELIAN